MVDQANREIELCATSEALDSYGTIFDYDASKDAFTRWVGNVREMHDAKAVGKRVAVRFDDTERKVYARLRISKGAEDTWQKVLDGTLQGGSIGASNVLWEKQARRIAGQQQTVDVAKRYDLMELSLVDHPSNPDALGVTFVRNGVPDVAVLDAVDAVEAGTSGGIAEGLAASSPSAPPLPSPVGLGSASILENAGTLSAEDPAQAIARAAMARGVAALRSPSGASSSPSEPPEVTAKRNRLASLGAPGYVNRAADGQGQVAVGSDNPSGDTLGSPAPQEGAAGYGVDQPYDVDGDHEDPSDYVSIQSGPTAGAVMAPSPAGSVAHMIHGHHHTGDWSDPSDHRESSAHQHLNGTSHVHEHVMDHRHGDHSGFPQGHNHPHGHVPDHDHSYRMADGSPIDARLVTAEQVRTFEYVSESAFRAARGTVGRPLSAQQVRAAIGHELRLMQADATRALGPYSRNPDGPADAGTPAKAQQHDSTDIMGVPEIGDGNGGVPAVNGVSDLEAELYRTGRCPLCQGQIRQLDRDGQPVSSDANGSDPVNTTGQVDVSGPPDGWDGRMVVAEVTRAVQSEVSRLSGQFTSIEQRLAKIEAQPMPGGPVFRSADKSTPLTPNGGRPGQAEQIRALEALAGRIGDPQAQVAVAAEMIRLQQEAAGMAPAMQVMPRAGQGWGQ